MFLKSFAGNKYRGHLVLYASFLSQGLTNMSDSLPSVFLSYTHESTEHKQWVARLATDLRLNGVNALLDQWECEPGTDLSRYMERGIADSDRVVLVCTPSYAAKSRDAKGGVGYERLVVNGQLAQNVDTNKFICILRSGSADTTIPEYAQARLFLDFSQDECYKDAFTNLLRTILGAPASPKPSVGPNPFAGDSLEVRFSNTAEPEKQEKPPIGKSPFESGQAKLDRSVRRERLPDTCRAMTHKFNISGHEGVVVVSLYPDGRVGAIKISIMKEGSTIGGMFQGFGDAVSLCLQYGVPLEVLVNKFSHTRFEPWGFTKNPDIKIAKSILDYVFRWLGISFLPGYREVAAALRPPSPNS
jgi:hypothetical protein